MATLSIQRSCPSDHWPAGGLMPPHAGTGRPGDPGRSGRCVTVWGMCHSTDRGATRAARGAWLRRDCRRLRQGWPQFLSGADSPSDPDQGTPRLPRSRHSRADEKTEPPSSKKRRPGRLRYRLGRPGGLAGRARDLGPVPSEGRLVRVGPAARPHTDETAPFSGLPNLPRPRPDGRAAQQMRTHFENVGR